MKPELLKVVAIALVTLILLSCKDDKDEKAPEGKLVLTFNNLINGDPLQIGSGLKYTNPHGEDFRVEEFKYYISNIKIRNIATGQFFIESNSYHLIKPDNASNVNSIEISGVPEGDYTEIEFSIGVDNAKNTSIDNIGDLDPSNDMAWDWNSGYKFMLLEGRYFTSSTGSSGGGLVFHVGENKNYKTLKFKLTDLGMPLLKVSNGKSAKVEVKAEVTEMWKTPYLINFDEMNEAMFGADAQKIADNYADGMFSISAVE